MFEAVANPKLRNVGFGEQAGRTPAEVAKYMLGKVPPPHVALLCESNRRNADLTDHSSGLDRVWRVLAARGRARRRARARARRANALKLISADLAVHSSGPPANV